MFAWISKDIIGNQMVFHVCAHFLGVSSDCCYAQILKGKVDIQVVSDFHALFWDVFEEYFLLQILMDIFDMQKV